MSFKRAEHYTLDPYMADALNVSSSMVLEYVRDVDVGVKLEYAPILELKNSLTNKRFEFYHISLEHLIPIVKSNYKGKRESGCIS